MLLEIFNFLATISLALPFLVSGFAFFVSFNVKRLGLLTLDFLFLMIKNYVTSHIFEKYSMSSIFLSIN